MLTKPGTTSPARIAHGAKIAKQAKSRAVADANRFNTKFENSPHWVFVKIPPTIFRIMPISMAVRRPMRGVTLQLVDAVAGAYRV